MEFSRLSYLCKSRFSSILFYLSLAYLQPYNGVVLTSADTSLSNAAIFQYNTTLETADSVVYKKTPTLELTINEPANIMTGATSTNLTAITWAHAVNSQRELKEALNSTIGMIEADIVLGTLDNTGSQLPVMGHPPAVNSDITLESFLRQVMSYNAEHVNATKGIKLDFKTIEVFEGAMDILNELVPMITVPVWLNADIVPGPVNATETVPVDPARFLTGCANFEKAVLSIGWTTRWGANYTEGNYTTQEIDAMLQVIKSNNVTMTRQPITFPVRAGIAANSLEQLHELVSAVNDTNDSTLTIWSSQNDQVNINKLKQLIFSFGVDRVYLDVPDEVASKLDLGRNSGSIKLSSFLNFSIAGMCLFVASLWLRRLQL